VGEAEAPMTDPLERERQLQDEAAVVLADLELLPLLQQLGRPVQVGSVPLGLMVARDIDLTVLCSELDATRIFELARPLAAHWFVHEQSRQFDLEHLESLPPRLTPETRLAILEIKEACLGRPWHSSYGIYTAVLDHGVRTPEGFCAHLEGTT
jgi:hypothetical protein